MTQTTSSIGPIRYNPAEGAFEALVTVSGPDGSSRVAAVAEAPIDTSYPAAIAALRNAAIRSLDRPETLRSRTRRTSDRMVENANPIQRFFGTLFGNRAA